MDRESLVIGEYEVTTVVSGGPWFSNCHVVRHLPSDEILVVDPGGDQDEILDAIAETGGTVAMVLLTHAHPDHVGATRAIQDTWDVPCALHRKEQDNLANVAELGLTMLNAAVAPPKQHSFFDEITLPTLGGQVVTILETPGHSPGSVCLLFDTFVLTGDTIYREGIGRTDFPGGNRAELGDSIDLILSSLDDGTVMLAGHGPRWTAGEARVWWRWANEIV